MLRFWRLQEGKAEVSGSWVFKGVRMASQNFWAQRLCQLYSVLPTQPSSGSSVIVYLNGQPARRRSSSAKDGVPIQNCAPVNAADGL